LPHVPRSRSSPGRCAGPSAAPPRPHPYPKEN
jgi:hypothetical protein